MLQYLDKLHSQVVQSPFLSRFTILNRLLLSVAFIPTGLVKLMYERFTQMSLDSPIGFFFEAFYQNELWYKSVGLSQILAGILLLIPRTAHLGSFLFLPIIFNINLITFGVGFKGTTYITSLMLLSNLYLVAWEYPYWRPFFRPQNSFISYKKLFSPFEKITISAGALSLMVVFLGTRGYASKFLMQISFGMLAISILLYGIYLIRMWVRRKGKKV